MRLSVELECRNIGTKIAARTMNTSQARASQAPNPRRFERGRRNFSPGSFGSGSSSASSVSAMVLGELLGDDASMPQPRIEDRVEDVDDDVDEDVADCDHDDEALEHYELPL